MAKKEFRYRGFKLEELKSLSIKEFADIAGSRVKRSIQRGFTEAQKKFLKAVEKNPNKLKTHCRNMIILPNMVGLTIGVHTGKEFKSIIVQPEMIGHYLGEFALSRGRVSHSSPGVGATKSSASVSVK